MERKNELLAKIREIKDNIQEMSDQQTKLKESSSEYKAIMELDKIITESNQTLIELEGQFAHVEDKHEKYHWDSLEQNIYKSFDSFHKAFTQAGTMFKRFK